jgi:hypothetical protein
VFVYNFGPIFGIGHVETNFRKQIQGVLNFENLRLLMLVLTRLILDWLKARLMKNVGIAIP